MHQYGVEVLGDSTLAQLNAMWQGLFLLWADFGIEHVLGYLINEKYFSFFVGFHFGAYLCISGNKFPRGPDEFGSGLDAFLNPVRLCEGFVAPEPKMEVRLYVSIWKNMFFFLILFF